MTGDGAPRPKETAVKTLIVAAENQRLKQEQDTFDQNRIQDSRWFILQLIVGSIASVSLPAIAIFCAVVLSHWNDYPAAVITAASAVLFADIIAFFIAAQKIVLGKPRDRLKPTTETALSHLADDFQVSEAAPDELDGDEGMRENLVDVPDQREIRGSALATYADYPVILSADGKPELDLKRLTLVANDILQQKDSYAAYELLYLINRSTSIDPPTDIANADDLRAKLRSIVPARVTTQLDHDRTAIIASATLLIRGLGATFANCGIEFVLHDVRDPVHSVIVIENSISGRSLDSSTTNFGLRLIRKYAHDRIAENYTAYELDLKGRPVKSSTFPILDRLGHLVALFCVNIDISWKPSLDHQIDAEFFKLLSALAWTGSTKVDELIMQISSASPEPDGRAN